MSAWIYKCMPSMDCVNKICSIDAILPYALHSFFLPSISA